MGFHVYPAQKGSISKVITTRAKGVPGDHTGNRMIHRIWHPVASSALKDQNMTNSGFTGALLAKKGSSISTKLKNARSVMNQKYVL